MMRIVAGRPEKYLANTQSPSKRDCPPISKALSFLMNLPRRGSSTCLAAPLVLPPICTSLRPHTGRPTCRWPGPPVSMPAPYTFTRPGNVSSGLRQQVSRLSHTSRRAWLPPCHPRTSIYKHVMNPKATHAFISPTFPTPGYGGLRGLLRNLPSIYGFLVLTVSLAMEANEHQTTKKKM